ncbi:MAG: MazG-like family protein [Candidatus Sumerlaeia bacterium]|nr:MazG-like family protein [Candidatus Sumerlaeia bacterium]
MPPELHALRQAVAALEPVQAAFDAYQRAAFPERSPQFFALELAGEAGEVANNEKKVWKGKAVPREHLEDEAADVLIALMNYANSNRIDLAGAVSAKLAEIERRRHI